MRQSSPQPTTLWLVRHGRTDWNDEGRYQGQTDIPLNAQGLAQAEALAGRLDGQTFDAVYSSDLQRAYRTAQILVRDQDVPICRDPRLREINQGDWEGLLFQDIKQRYTSEMAQRSDDPANARPPGGESVAELAARVSAAVDEIASTHPGETVLIVSHGLAIATLLARIRGIPLTQAYDLIPKNTTPEIVPWPVPEPGRA